LSDSLARFGRSTIPPWLKTLSTGALEAGTENVRNTAGTSLSYVAAFFIQKPSASNWLSVSAVLTHRYFANSSAVAGKKDLEKDLLAEPPSPSPSPSPQLSSPSPSPSPSPAKWT